MSQQMFDQRGKRIFLASDRGTERADIPAGVYSVEFNPMAGWYLEQTAMPSRPKRLYGDVADRATRILNTYLDRLKIPGKNTAALLSGNKGSGKTMLSAEVAVAAVESGFPVILINSGITDPSFFKFLNSITQPCIILIDEFEKKYKDDEEQNELLGLLDGINAGGKLFILTSNKSFVSEFLMSRPSRIFYHYRYDKLDEATVRGYCEDNLIEASKHQFDNIKTLWDFSTDFNFDVLQCLVEELNRYPEVSFIDCMKVLNITVSGLIERRFTIGKIELDGVDINHHKGQQTTVNIVDFIDGKSKPVMGVTVEKEDDCKFLEEVLGKSFYHGNRTYFERKEKGELTDDDYYDDDCRIFFSYNSSNITASSEEITGFWESNGRKLEIELYASRKSSTEDMYEKIFTN